MFGQSSGATDLLLGTGGFGGGLGNGYGNDASGLANAATGRVDPQRLISMTFRV